MLCICICICACTVFLYAFQCALLQSAVLGCWVGDVSSIDDAHVSLCWINDPVMASSITPRIIAHRCQHHHCRRHRCHCHRCLHLHCQHLCCQHQHRCQHHHCNRHHQHCVVIVINYLMTEQPISLGIAQTRDCSDVW